MKVPVPYGIKKEYLEELVKVSEKNLHEISKNVLEGLKPESGAYNFFNTISHILSRVQDIGKIINRLFEEVHLMVELSIEERRKMPKVFPPGIPYPEEIQKLMRKSGVANGLAQLDMESLYIFSQILLDQWALLAAMVGKLPIKKVHPFSELVNYLEVNQDSSISFIWDKYSEQILWMYYQIRFVNLAAIDFTLCTNALVGF